MPLFFRERWDVQGACQNTGPNRVRGVCLTRGTSPLSSSSRRLQGPLSLTSDAAPDGQLDSPNGRNANMSLLPERHRRAGGHHRETPPEPWPEICGSARSVAAGGVVRGERQALGGSRQAESLANRPTVATSSAPDPAAFRRLASDLRSPGA